MNSRGRYPRKGLAGRARTRKEEEYANSLGASPINDKNPSAMSQGRFMSKRYDRGKALSNKRNQFCTDSARCSGSLASLSSDACSTGSFKSPSDDVRLAGSLTNISNDAGSASSKRFFTCHGNDKYASLMNEGKYVSKSQGRGKEFSGIRSLFSAGSSQSTGPITSLGNGACGSLGRRSLKNFNNGTRGTGSLNGARSTPGTKFLLNFNKGAHSKQGTRSSKSLSNAECLEKNKPKKLDLNSMLDLQADEIVLEILQQPSCFKDIFTKDDINDDVMLSLIGVLACAVNTTFNKEKLYHLLYEALQTRFINKLCTFTITVKKMNVGRAIQFFDNLANVLGVYSHAMVYSAVDKFPSLIDACIASQIALKLSPKILEKYECLQEMLSQVIFSFKNNHRGPNVLNRFKLTPPTDFFLIPVYPTKEDLDDYGYPFLRPNITEGKYENCRHYLDVHFRLLREDFMRPLREGVTAYKKDAQSKNLDVWVNRNVKILKPDIVKRELIHYIKLELPKMFSAANSKRFMFGNLLCFSWDNFESIIIATVFDSDYKKLRNGILAVKFESNIELDYSKEYVMIESRAFFLAYKHVLTALIKMCGEELPFSSYFVHIQSDVKPPDYLTNEDKYDLSVLIDKNSSYMMKYRLQDVRIMQDLESWPSETDLGLDTSQRRVLKNALTRELVIIQGPPGTGKTFIGLKIAQLLLHNNLYLPGPILVVCFTNHALDQFLEGVMSFTENIVRVGSRINNEKIQKFQINTLLRLTKHRMYYNNYNSSNLYSQLNDLEEEIRSLKVSIMECIEPKGILRLEELTGCGIIPCHLQSLIKNFHCGLVGWLTAEQDYTYVCPGSQDMLASSVSSTSNSVECEEFFDAISEFSESSCEEVELMKDVKELNRTEEHSRKVELYNDVQEGKIIGRSLLHYELEIRSLHVKIEKLKRKIEAEPKDIVSVVNYIINMGISAKVKAGLAVKNVPKEIATVGDKNIDLLTLDFTSRWHLYRSWLNVLIQNLKIRLCKAEAEYKETSQELNKVLDQRYVDIMKQSSVVGMTTTAAAQHYSVMQAIAPPVVIIEEAAEVLESHVITSLSTNCKHLIMIGDHKQLRPSTTVNDLATKFGLDVSLFERMINNGLPYDTLEYQHRMRPSISRLLVPSIYSELKDHESVHDYPHIRGVSGDIFFVTHNVPQDKGVCNGSHSNTHEAKFIMGLCHHLIMQDYDPADVTILTPYSGQFFLLREVKCSEPATSKSCLGKCPLLLKCGHPCTKRCCDPCTERCLQQVSYASCPWNHSITKPCYVSNKRPMEATWSFCRERCGQVLPCGHPCRGSCGLCLQGRLHLPCIKRCERKLVCGHRCQELCGTRCPPCRQTIKWCPHESKMMCGSGLPVCQKPCSWTCKHHQCSSKCSDKCPIPLCQEPCPKTLKCGHLCIGFCGDPCPPLCIVCHDAENVPVVDKARYVLLEECGHIIEVKALDTWLMKQSDGIGLKTCPKCSNPIHYNRRYKRIIQGTHQDLSTVKQMFMTKKPNISSLEVANSLRDFILGDYFSSELYTLMATMNMVPNKNFKKKWTQDTPNLSYTELRLLHFKAKVLKKAFMIKAHVMEHNSRSPYWVGSLMLFAFKDRLLPQLETLVKRVMELRCHEASELIHAVSCELQRLLLLPSFWYFEKNCQLDPDPQMKDAHDKLSILFNPKNKFTHQQETEALDIFRKCGDNSSKYLIIYDYRRVTTQMGLKMTQGVWFKCHQGHIYATELKEHKCYRCMGRGVKT